MDHWTSGRVTLIGDAGYSPGAAVGGGTSIAMVGAYILARNSARLTGNWQAGLRAYEDRMRPIVAKARSAGPAAMSMLIPQSGLQVRLMPEMLRLVKRMPPRLEHRLARWQQTPGCRPSTESSCTAPSRQGDGDVRCLCIDTYGWICDGLKNRQPPTLASAVARDPNGCRVAGDQVNRCRPAGVRVPPVTPRIHLAPSSSQGRLQRRKRLIWRSALARLSTGRSGVSPRGWLRLAAGERCSGVARDQHAPHPEQPRRGQLVGVGAPLRLPGRGRY